jgi:hypothetical protein
MTNATLVVKPGLSLSMYNHLVQPKLEINSPGGRYEQEADAMAYSVMRTSSTNAAVKPATGLIGRSVQRKCTECEEEEKKKLMRKTEGTGYGINASPALVSSINASKGGGSPLPQETRDFMENAFSRDFSRVRVHADSVASEMSKGIGAKAFTTGNDIYFKSGQYNTESAEGKKLLAHELTHVVQQENSGYRISKNEDDSVDGSNTQILSASENTISDFDQGDNSQQVTVDQAQQASSCPINAIFLSTVAGQEKANCRVPQGKQGVSTLARFRLQGTSPGQNVTVSEQFAPMEDPYSIFSKLVPNTYQPANGIFDDCYLLASDNSLPPDFRLKVLQNHLVNGNIISKNEILYTVNGVRFCNHSRNRNDCGFSNRCK